VRSASRAVVATCLIVVLGCQSAAPPSSSTSTAAPLGSDGNAQLGKLGVDLPADYFTAKADPLTLTSTAEAGRASAMVLDSAGGTVEATAADGTRYRLDVPENALPYPVTVTLTPLDGIAGFPGGDPAHRVGVDLQPEGLQLWAPATLTITPATAAPPGVATTSARQGGLDAAAVFARQDATTITFSIEHFSEYHAFWPLDEPAWRALARVQQEQAELRLRSEVAVLLERERSLQLAFGDSEVDLLKLAKALLPRFKAEIVEPRIQAATFGCRETIEAIITIISYQRQAQELGVADDPEFAIEIPPTLFALEVDHCYREQFLRCQAFGDFRGFLAYIFEGFVRSTDITGNPPDESVVALAHEYLKRCGHWRVTINTSEILDSENEYQQFEFARTFDLRWQPGPPETSGYFGLLGSDITATAPVVINKMVDRNKGNGREAVFSDIKIDDAFVELQTINFLLTTDVAPDGSVTQGEPIPYEAQISATLGAVRATAVNGDSSFPVANDSVAVLQQIFGAFTNELLIDHGWQFSRRPFRATWAESGKSEGGQLVVRIEVTIEHTPDPAP
jgi:hypothetical protein